MVVGAESPGAAGIGPMVIGFDVVPSSLTGVSLTGPEARSMRPDPSGAPPAGVPPPGAGARPTGATGEAGAAGAPRTSGVSSVAEAPASPLSWRATGASAPGPLSGGFDSPGHPFTATRVLVNTSTHAAAATKDRVTPRVASRPLGVCTRPSSARERPG